MEINIPTGHPAIELLKDMEDPGGFLAACMEQVIHTTGQPVVEMRKYQKRTYQKSNRGQTNKGASLTWEDGGETWLPTDLFCWNCGAQNVYMRAGYNDPEDHYRCKACAMRSRIEVAVPIGRRRR